MGEPAVNGEKPSSQFISHLASYPVVHDSIEAYQANPYGKKSIKLAEHGYETFAKPMIPYLSKPYEYAAPYVHKADSLADSGLSKVDEKFPIVKDETEKVKGTVLDFATYPLKLVGDSKDYVFKTYQSEYKKCGGDGIVAGGKAFITTSLVITSDTLSWISEYLGSKKEEAKEAVKDKTNN
ncbi:MAG: hypothetical protein M1834_007136 [Cirrosporium novae-zelandiae]|nr:MAG: hypothetical protein M1834_007136 [Cirrosporium novae-zelandiae]